MPVEKEEILPSNPESDSKSFDGNSAELATKDVEYWILGDFVVFQAEKVLFRVPSIQFTQNSAFFAAMLDLPQGQETGDADDREGRSAKRPIILPSTITAFDFRSLLKALYPQQHTIASTKQILPYLTKQELTSILKLSTMWYFLDYRAHAIEKLYPMLTAVEKITIGREYKVLKVLRGGFEQMITRAEQIDEPEAVLIEPMTAVRLYRARETYKGYSTQTRQGLNLQVFLAERFGAELESIGLEELGYTASKV